MEIRMSWVPRRRTVFTLAVVGLCAAAVSCATLGSADVANPSVPRYTAETFFDTRSLFAANFSADGARLLLTSDESGVFNCYSLNVETGQTKPLTTSERDANFGVGWFPHDDRFLFTADQGGNELNHLFVRELDGSVVDLTPGEKLKAQFVGWGLDDKSFWVLTNERDPKFFDLYRHQFSTAAATAGGTAEAYPRQLVFENTEGYAVGDVSLDGRWLALSMTRTNADNDLYIWDTTAPTTPPRHITPHEGNVSHNIGAFTHDSKSLYFLSDANSEFTRMWSYDLAGGTPALVKEAPWDIQYVSFSRDGRYRVTGINADGRTEVEVVDTTTNEPVRFPGELRGNIGGVRISRSGKLMAFSLNSDTSPGNVYVLELKGGGARKLTNSLTPEVDESHLVSSSVVRYASFDDQKIPALLYKPHHASTRERVPALVWVHGGPGGQSRTGYNEIIQLLVNHGYGVLAVNNRGSSGYGKTFFHLDDRKHGEDDLQDCVYGRRYLEGLGWVDPHRVGIIGGSYGGYMVVAALAFQPNEFDVGIDIFGVTNWIRTLEQIPEWWASFREYLYAELGDPATDRERLRRISPLFHADRIKKPLLVIQGANDPRVQKAESDEIVAAVKKNGVPVEYVVFDDEGHGFRHKENRIEAANVYLEFLGKYLDGRSISP